MKNLPAPDADETDSISLLQRLAAEQVQADHNFLGKNRFVIDQQTRTLSYDLNPKPLRTILSQGDPYANPLEALIRIQSLRRDFLAIVPTELFWPAQVELIEQVIERCIRDVDKSRNGSEAQESCSKNVNEQFDKLKLLIEGYADNHGLLLLQPQLTRGIIGYRVHIAIEPPKARIRYMTLLEYKRSRYLEIPREKYQWIDLLSSESDMIGLYHYRAEWPSELNGVEEGDFEIKGPTSITFTPPPR